MPDLFHKLHAFPQVGLVVVILLLSTLPTPFAGTDEDRMAARGPARAA